ncbi:MAG: Rieske (2Fe-2S) protein [Verrucomicrobia bacterium]|nr:MAG: Rieske (2Fe-2S) protein [Verrucomicrobiota bacterium]
MNNPESISEPVPPLTRRAFVKAGMTVAGAAYAAALGYPLYRYLATPAERAALLAAVKEVALDGADKLPRHAALMFKFAGRPAILLHHDDDTWTALSAVCTHLGCTVQFDPEHNAIRCACHGGIYDARTGANVSGPPPKPLMAFKVQALTGKVVISRA